MEMAAELDSQYPGAEMTLSLSLGGLCRRVCTGCRVDWVVSKAPSSR